jgi:2-hydroxychromene-2-carboxylate isomerase
MQYGRRITADGMHSDATGREVELADRWRAAPRIVPRSPTGRAACARDFPLSEIHPHARAAAGFAEAAAAAQGLFWATHELLFHRQKALGEDDLFAYARQAGLDEAHLRDDLERDTSGSGCGTTASALASGARGTPTLFLNDRLHSATSIRSGRRRCPRRSRAARSG